jgi:hypothetical protein
MGFQKLVHALFDFLVGYRHENEQASQNSEEEIIKKLLLKVAKIKVFINRTDSWYLLEGYRKILLDMLKHECDLLFNQKIKDSSQLAGIFSNYIKKLEKISD